MTNSRDSLMVRAEARYHAEKAIYQKESADKLGNYYQIRWNFKNIDKDAPLLITFNYTQPSTGRKVNTISRTIPSSKKGMLKLQVIGDSYLKNGRVLAWKTEISQKSQKLATKQSFLWE